MIADGSGATTRVVHVDDEPAFADLVDEFLSRELPDCEVVTVPGAERALEELSAGIDCVVSDYEMPDTDGLELLRSVRERHPELPFILYTGKGSEEIASQAVNAGVTAYLQKGGPDQHRRLANQVRRATEEYRAKVESERYSTVLRALDYPIYVVDAEGRFEYVNDAFVELVGYDRETLVGSSPERIKTEDSVERIDEALRSVVSETGPDAERVEVAIEPAEGEPIPCQDHIAALPFEEEFRGCAGILRDIRAEKRRERELVRQNERLAEFVSIVSHDLRNPLSTAMTAAELAQETGDTEFFERLESAHDRMDRMLEELLTLAREGEMVAETEPVDIAAVAAAAWETAGAEAADLRIEVDDHVEADARRLRRLFENLFENAVRHAGPSVTLTVGSLERGFYVADDGPGIPDRHAETVFDPGVTTDDDGTGFGLTIVRRVAQAHGWEVRLADGETSGTRFEFVGVRSGARPPPAGEADRRQ